MIACCLIASSILVCASTSNGSALSASISRCRASSISPCRSCNCLKSAANRWGELSAAFASSGWVCRSWLKSSGFPNICNRIISASCGAPLPGAITLRPSSSIAFSDTPSPIIVDDG
ncbi:hypothetical protein L210DRAFT_3520104 [Boletus edulis BED1]|uniref:Secreted protein n=1 Tax=Boletus edulis BED1 TaxID=1328754 RepID=A0AAD4GKT3_BOLED|nr:hypothetical protein L210DRAFT_3520104 [Boletus edulis BED1]